MRRNGLQNRFTADFKSADYAEGQYIIRTELGKADFGLTLRLYNDKGELRIRLLPYSLSYFRQMDPDFSLPEYAKTDEKGIPDIPIFGLRKTGDFGL